MNTCKRLIKTVVFILIACVCTGSASANGPLTLGVHPYLPATVLVERFSPLAEHISGVIGRPVFVRISRSYDEHIEQVAEDHFDIAYMGPASYVKMVAMSGTKPLLARLEINGSPTFQGGIVALETSTINYVSDIRGKRFAFGDRNSTMGTLIPVHMLHEAGVGLDDLEGYNFLSNHINVALGVLIGKYDAGAVKEEVYYEYEDRGLKAVAMTPRISEHLLVSGSKLSVKEIKILRKALFDLKNSEEGREIMRSIKKEVTGFVPVDDHDYDNLRTVLGTVDQLVNTK